MNRTKPLLVQNYRSIQIANLT